MFYNILISLPKAKILLISIISKKEEELVRI